MPPSLIADSPDDVLETSTLLLCVQVWGHSKNPERAERVLDLMEVHATDSLLLSHDIRVLTFDRVQASGVAPDLSSFNRIITAWGQVTSPLV